MTFTAFLLILISAILHAAWNLLSKSNRPSLVFYMQSSLTASLLWSPGIFIGINQLNWQTVPGVFYWYFLGSLLCEILYFTGLANAYKRSDISLAYPMVRALPVLFTATLTMLLHIGKPLSGINLCGMIMIFSGCFIMPQSSLKDLKIKNYLTLPFIFIVLAACGTTGYTIADSQALKLLNNTFDTLSSSDKILISCMYLAAMEFAIAIALAVITPFIPAERYELKKSFCRSFIPSLSGAFGSLSYGIILLSMPMISNVSLVQAFRQISLPICALAGVWLLHEKMTILRGIGLTMTAGGLILSVL